MAIHSVTEKTTYADEGETVVHAAGRTETVNHAEDQTMPRVGGSTRPTGFARTPTAHQPSAFSSQHQPETSSLGRYISIGIIIVLVILLIYQVATKGGLRNQVRTLESENETLITKTAELQKEVDRLSAIQPDPATTTQQPAATTQPATATGDGGTLTLYTYPILYRENTYQKIAQTISVTTTAKISGVHLRGAAGTGSAGQVAIYESPNLGRLNDTQPLVRQSFDTSKIPVNQAFAVQFQKPIELKASVGYLLVVETTRQDAQAQIAYRSATTTAPGTMWVYSRKLSENEQVISADFSWQEIPGFDLFFELRGVE